MMAIAPQLRLGDVLAANLAPSAATIRRTTARPATPASRQPGKPAPAAAPAIPAYPDAEGVLRPDVERRDLADDWVPWHRLLLLAAAEDADDPEGLYFRLASLRWDGLRLRRTARGTWRLEADAGYRGDWGMERMYLMPYQARIKALLALLDTCAEPEPAAAEAAAPDDLAHVPPADDTAASAAYLRGLRVQTKTTRKD